MVEAVGIPKTFELCTRLVRPGGHVANVGVHGRPVTLHLEDLWIKNVTITTGLVDTSSTPTLLAMLATGQLATRDLVTTTSRCPRCSTPTASSGTPPRPGRSRSCSRDV